MYPCGNGGPCRVVGATGFEPATSCSQSKRSTRLSYAPRRNGIAPHHDMKAGPRCQGKNALCCKLALQCRYGIWFATVVRATSLFGAAELWSAGAVLPLFIAEPCSAQDGQRHRQHGCRTESGSMAPALQRCRRRDRWKQRVRKRHRSAFLLNLIHPRRKVVGVSANQIAEHVHTPSASRPGEIKRTFLNTVCQEFWTPAK